MANFPNQQLTNVGWDALSEALAGQRLKFVRMVVGDGEMDAGETVEELANRTSLIHYVMDVPITDWRAVGQGKMFITGTLRSSQIATGFRLREIGLMVTLTPLDTEVEGPQILYSINNTGEEYDYIPSKEEGSVVIQAIEVQVIISKAERVEVDVVLGEAGLEGDNLGDGAEVFVERAGNRFRYRTLKGRATGLIPVTITQTRDEIEIGASLGTGGGGNGSGSGEDGSGTAPPIAIAPGVGVIETGMLVPFAGNIAPVGYLIANGRAVSRTGYAGLFAVCGTRYGAGDGTTTFNIPDCRYRSLVGAGSLDTNANFTLALGHKGGAPTLTLTAAHMPAHTHNVDIDHYHNISTGAHNHGDPGHNHPDPGHNHHLNHGWHSHGFTMTNKYQAHWVGTGWAAEVAGTSNTHGAASGDWNNGSGAGLWGAGCGLHQAGNLGGSTAWVSAMQTNWQHRTTTSQGSGEAFELLSPRLGVNYIIKT